MRHCPYGDPLRPVQQEMVIIWEDAISKSMLCQLQFEESGIPPLKVMSVGEPVDISVRWCYDTESMGGSMEKAGADDNHVKKP